MRFPCVFSRSKGPGAFPALGSDPSPNASTPPQPPTPAPNGNLMTGPFFNNNGWPCHRIAVAYKGPPLPVALNGTLWMWEDQTQHWYQIGGTVSIAPDAISFFDVVGLLDTANTRGDLNQAAAGSLAVQLVVTDPGGAPAGTHTFAVGPDLTTI